MSDSGEVTAHPDDLIRTIDLSTATLVHTSAITLTSGDFQNALNHTASSLQGSYAGNTVDYANSIAIAAGLSEYGVGPVDYSLHPDSTIDPGLRVDGLAAHLDPMTKAAQYALGTSYLLGSQWDTLWNDNRADWALSDMQAIMERVGNSIKLQELKKFAEAWSEAGGTPLAIDLNGDGVKTISLAYSKVDFDITGDGAVERTGWLSPDDAFLTLDRNGNGLIDNVNELFGGVGRGKGYVRLAELDDNDDSAITVEDSCFNSLKLWRDQNSNGLTDAGELFSLQELGITALGLDYITQTVRHQGNLLGETSFAKRSGQDIEMADVYFRFTSIEEAEKGVYLGRPLRAPATQANPALRTANREEAATEYEETDPASLTVHLLPQVNGPIYMETMSSNYSGLAPFPV